MGCNQSFPMQANLNPGKTQFLEQFQGKGYTVYQFKTGQLAIFSYLVISGDSAILIDPTFDTMIYQETLTKTKATLKHILLTHFHADYVAGHLEFKVPLIMGERASRPGLGFKVEEQKNGSTITLGEVKLTVIHTPGHTLESSCYMLTDREGKDDILFTGDTLFLGEIGRPDLAVSSEMKSEDLAGLLFDSLQKIKALNPHLKILPGHGSGSSCGKSIGDGNVCTLEKQLKNNYALNITSKAEFVKKVLEDMPKAPQYFFHDAKLNQTGPPSFQTQFKQNSTLLTIDQFKDALKKGSVVVDTRANMEQLKKGYIKGAFLMAESGAFSNWVGALLDPKKEVLIFVEKDKSDEVAERLARIGYRANGFNGFTIDEWKASGGEVTVPTFATIADLKGNEKKFILDVRGEGEHKDGHIEGSVNIPFGKIADNLGKIPKDKTIYVHCKTGMRARLGSSILAKNGFEPHVLPVKFEDFAQAGLPVVKG